jgi:thiol-disulfide isomerase/thioredoxin
MTSLSRSRFFQLALVLAAGVALLGWYSVRDDAKIVEPVSAAETGGVFDAKLATGEMSKLIVHRDRRDLPQLAFKDGKGTALDLTAWKGRVVVLNLWAIWCPPCRKEMPDLSALQKTLGGPEFDVVALSVDVKGYQVAHDFLKEVGADNITLVNDSTMKSLNALREIGLPITVIIDKQGKEAARHIGDAKWNAPEAIAVMKTLMAEQP